MRPNNNDNLKLYLPFIGKHNTTITEDYSNSRHAPTFYGDAVISSAQYYERVSSLYTTNGYLSFPSSVDWDLGTVWTLKIKVYPTSSASSDRNILSHFDASAPYDGWIFYQKVTSNYPVLRYYVNDSVTLDMIGNIALNINAWNDITITCDGSLMTMYLNGVPCAYSAYVACPATTTAEPLRVGNALAQPFVGYIADVMIVKNESWDGHVFRNSTLSLPTVAWKLGEYTVYDCIGSNHLTNAGMTFTTDGLQGRKCGYSNGTWAAIRNDSLFSIGGVDFYISVWFNLDSSIDATPRHIFSCRHITDGISVGKGYWNFAMQNTYGIAFYASNKTGSSTFVTAFSYNCDTFNPTPGNWYHAVVQRRLGVYTLHINGIEQTWTGSTFNAEVYDIEAPVNVCSEDGLSGRTLRGKIQELIFKKSSYLSDSEITELYNEGRAKLLQLDTRQHKQSFVHDYIDSYANKTVAYWGLDEMVGKRKDKVNHYTLDLINNPGYYDDPVFGKVLDLNGSNQYVQTTALAANDPLHLLGCHSVNMWINADVISGALMVMIYGGLEGWMTISPSGLLYTFVASNNSTRYGNSAQAYTFNTGTWYMLTCVLDTADNKIKLYVNGSLISDTQSYDGTLTSAVGNPDGGPSGGLVFGGMPWSGVSYFNGKMKGILIANGVALSPTAISYLYNNGIGRFPSYNWQVNRPYPAGHLIDVIGMRETSGNRTGLKLNLIATQTGTVGASDGLKFAGCAEFSDGNYLTIATTEWDLAELVAQQRFTIFGWFRTASSSIVSHICGCYSLNAGFSVMLQADNQLVASLYSTTPTTWSISVPGTTYQNGAWHFMLITCDNEKMTLWMDGVRVGEVVITGNVSDSGVGFSLGLIGPGESSTYAFNGEMQEFAFIDVPVDSAFIKNAWEQGRAWLYEYSNALYNTPDTGWTLAMTDYNS